MPFKRQALVEFSAVESADRCVSSGAKVPVYIAGLIGFILKKKMQEYFDSSHFTEKKCRHDMNLTQHNTVYSGVMIKYLITGQDKKVHVYLKKLNEHTKNMYISKNLI